MSGGVPKRVRISQTQSNTPSKSGRWGKPGIILCSGTRSRRPMCNSIQTRAKYCATPCTPPVPLNLLLFNTFNDISKNQGVVAPTGLDTVITVYKTPTTAAADAVVVDDTNNQATTGVPPTTVPLEWNTPQNYAVYDDTVYQDVFSSAYSSVDFNVDNMNGGDTYRFIISTFRTFDALGGIDTATGVPDPSNYPAYGQVTTTVNPGAGATTLEPRLQFNYGIASQMPPNSELNKLQIPPTPATGFTTGIAVPDALPPANPDLPPGLYYYLTVDVTLSADKKTVTHKIIT